MEVYIVDVFTSKNYGGNTAGVVLYHKLEDAYMQKLAYKLGFSETAFVKKISDDKFNIKFFTPNSEVELCGHATIASFEVLKHVGYVKATMNCLAGNLTIYIENDIILLEQAPPKAGSVLDSPADIKNLSESLNIAASLIGDLTHDLKPQIIYTGLWDILLPVKNRKVLLDINPNFHCITSISEEKAVVGIHAFTLDDEDLANCRNFAPLYGINEEAATGTSNGALTYYLYINNVINNLNRTYTINQGVSMNRPSKIYTKVINDTGLKILVGGSAFILSQQALPLLHMF